MLTLDNHISFCSEVYESFNDYRDVFIYGKLERDEIKINKKKLDTLKSRKGTSLDECKNCTLVKVCAGQCPARALEENDTIFSVNKNLCELTRNVFYDYLVYQVHKKFIRIRPYIKEGKELEFQMIFNKFKLGENKFEKNPYLKINQSVNVNEIKKKIEEYDKRNPYKFFFFSFSNLTPRKALNFLKEMREKRIPFLVTKPIFSCNEPRLLDKKILEDFRIPKDCKDCLELYRVTKNGKVKFCTGQIGKKLSEYDTRDEIYKDFLNLSKNLSKECKICIHRLRGNCNGKYC